MLEQLLKKLSGYERGQSVVITCDGSSRHGELVKVFDLCVEAGFENLSVFSLRN